VAKVYSSIKSAMPEIEAPEIMLIFNQKADFTALPDVMMYKNPTPTPQAMRGLKM
jgi:hypothetical protein